MRKTDFCAEYLREIRFICLCMSDGYIDAHFGDITRYASCIESRLDDADCTAEALKRENRRYAAGCKAHGLDIVMIEKDYEKTVTDVEIRRENILWQN